MSNTSSNGAPTVWQLAGLDEQALVRLGEVLALGLRRGDVVRLEGDLGAGKTTLARAMIRALLTDDAAEVPSPTFALQQNYATPRLPVAHLDLYRLGSAAELFELGIDDAIADGAVLVEWPDRAEGALPAAGITIRLAETDGGARREVTIAATGPASARLARLRLLEAFLARVLGPAARARTRVTYLQGDASARAYARLDGPAGPALLMDSPRMPDGPAVRDGLPYSRIAHLAEDVRPFVAVCRLLDGAGFSVPRVTAHDLDGGCLLVEDLGDRVFGRELAAGASQEMLWSAAVDALVALRAVDASGPLPLPDGSAYRIPTYDARALAIETELVLDWLWPAVKGAPAPRSARDAYVAAWAAVIAKLVALPSGLVLRDVHSPNLIWLPERDGVRRVGLIDFQDAVLGPPAYDAVSLLQDARLDVSAELEQCRVRRYVMRARAVDPAFDEPAFRFSYAALGCQRNSKILGIFARLSRRDGKHGYLAHIPRIWGYLERGLTHPELAAVRAWYDEHWPIETRMAPAQL